ncbi:MAG: hypothetical protein ACI4JM_02290, partial [Oscillospiraceae bacterium]
KGEIKSFCPAFFKKLESLYERSSQNSNNQISIKPQWATNAPTKTENNFCANIFRSIKSEMNYILCGKIM